jgi:hypothetical protein
MTDRVLREIVVPAEEATFWMDRWGNWCNRHGRFEHRKIIAYFNAAIMRDEQGYFVSQINGNVREKVYFRYEETALFVFDVQPGEALKLVLNTGREVGLKPGMLFIRNDHLYAREGDELIKFNEGSMLKISHFFDDAQDQCFLDYKGQRTAIPVMIDQPSTEIQPADDLQD